MTSDRSNTPGECVCMSVTGAETSAIVFSCRREEPPGRANACPMTGSATKQSMLPARRSGLLRFARNDVVGVECRSRKRGCDAWACGATRGIPGRHIGNGPPEARPLRLHVVVVRVLADVADIENDGFLAEVLPPVRGAEHFGPDFAGLVDDRLGAVAGVFDDLALLHEDQRRTIVMAVPRHDAAGLDRQLAEAQLAILQVPAAFRDRSRPASRR